MIKYIEPCIIFLDEEQFSEIVKTAKYLGYSYVVGFVEFNKKSLKNPDEIEDKIINISKKYEVKSFFGILFKDHKKLKYVPKIRKGFDAVGVIGGNIKTNRLALESVYVDFLFDPYKDRKKDSGINHIFARIASKNSVMISINATRIQEMTESKLPYEITKIRELIRVSKRYKTPLTISSCAKDPEDLKDPLALTSFLHIMGLDMKSSKLALSSVPLRILEQNNEKRSKNWIMPGVRVKKWGATKK